MIRQLSKKIEFPKDLPVTSRHDEILEAIKKNQVTIISGETGSGKTTQIPKICLELGLGQKKIIGHTQPRRIAARSVASRIAEELHSNLGDLVGFKVRFAEKITKNTAIKLMTDGILLAETQQDPMLNQYDTLIIDEAHERSLNIDFILGYLKNLLPKRPDLKIIITSATIDVEKFAQHFSAPIIQVSGRTFPVEIIYRPLQQVSEALIESLDEAIVGAINDLGQLHGDILIFLPGERDIHDTNRFLKDYFNDRYEVLPLFSRLPLQEQQKIFQVSTRKRIILSTNIAETSLTVPNIHYVIDSGLARVVRYSPRMKIDQLHIEKISKASANQRTGRCGRVGPGICIRLFEEEDYQLRQDFTDPEILRTSLASVILRMADLNLGAVDQFPFIQPPSYRLIQDGYQLLFELGAVDVDNQILPLGKQLSMLPIDPSHARIIIEAKKENCLSEILVIISALSVSDPRERPIDKADKADQAHLQFHDPESGFLIFIKLWSRFKQEAQNVSSKSLRKFCEKYFLSFNRLREWLELQKQLSGIVGELQFNLNQTEATYDQIHRALLSGLLSNVGQAEMESQHYLGTRGIKFLIGPRLFRNKKLKWVMAAEIIDTGKLYAQCVAKIDVSWVEKLAQHIVEYEYSNPRWNMKLGRVDASRKSLLYGLVINPSQTVHYGPIDPSTSRTILIRQALVEKNYESTSPFWLHNQKLIDEVRDLEHKARRQDILINDDVIFDFYNKKLDEDIVNIEGFEHWRKKKERDDPEYLFLTKAFLMQHDADKIDMVQYPDKQKFNGYEVNLSYFFEPGHPRDGLSVILPLSGLNLIDEKKLDWLVPGMIREKVTSLIKNLPKGLRGQCGHLQTAVTEFLSEYSPKTNFNDVFTEFVRQKTKTRYRISAQEIQDLPTHLRPNYIVVDDQGVTLDEGRDISKLKEHNKEAITEIIESIDFGIEQERLKYWPDDPLPEKLEITHQKTTLIGYPALVDRGEWVDILVFDDLNDAKNKNKQGIKRLVSIQLNEKIKIIKKDQVSLSETSIRLGKIISADALKQNMIEVVLDEILNSFKSQIQTKADFERLIIHAHKHFSGLMHTVSDELMLIAQSFHDLSRMRSSMNNLPSKVIEDIDEQVEILLPPYEKPLFKFDRLRDFNRYLKGIIIRLDKFNQRPTKDLELMSEVNRLKNKWIEKVVRYVENDEDVPHGFIDFQWDMQELRVSLFAQELKTAYPISIKRLDERWMKLID